MNCLEHSICKSLIEGSKQFKDTDEQSLFVDVGKFDEFIDQFLTNFFDQFFDQNFDEFFDEYFDEFFQEFYF